MTCIVGFIEGNTVYMGGDSAGVAGLDIVGRKDTKVFTKGEFVIGYTSSFRMGQLLRFNLTIPKHYPDMDVYEYMVTEFVTAVRACLKEGGYTNVTNNEETGGTFLVGYRGRLFEIESDFQVGENILPFNSVGCGRSYALGALYSISNTEVPVKAKIEIALKAACEFSAGVREPFTVIKTND